jgi:hypothetical protein
MYDVFMSVNETGCDPDTPPQISVVGSVSTQIDLLIGRVQERKESPKTN